MAAARKVFGYLFVLNKLGELSAKYRSVPLKGLTFGRHCSVRISNKALAEEHAMLVPDVDGKLFMKNLRVNTGGFFVNNERHADREPVQVVHLDIIVIGKAHFQIYKELPEAFKAAAEVKENESATTNDAAESKPKRPSPREPVPEPLPIATLKEDGLCAENVREDTKKEKMVAKEVTLEEMSTAIRKVSHQEPVVAQETVVSEKVVKVNEEKHGDGRSTSVSPMENMGQELAGSNVDPESGKDAKQQSGNLNLVVPASATHAFSLSQALDERRRHDERDAELNADTEKQLQELREQVVVEQRSIPKRQQNPSDLRDVSESESLSEATYAHQSRERAPSLNGSICNLFARPKRERNLEHENEKERRVQRLVLGADYDADSKEPQPNAAIETEQKKTGEKAADQREERSKEVEKADTRGNDSERLVVDGECSGEVQEVDKAERKVNINDELAIVKTIEENADSMDVEETLPQIQLLRIAKKKPIKTIAKSLEVEKESLKKGTERLHEDCILGSAMKHIPLYDQKSRWLKTALAVTGPRLRRKSETEDEMKHYERPQVLKRRRMSTQGGRKNPKRARSEPVRVDTSDSASLSQIFEAGEEESDVAEPVSSKGMSYIYEKSSERNMRPASKNRKHRLKGPDSYSESERIRRSKWAPKAGTISARTSRPQKHGLGI